MTPQTYFYNLGLNLVSESLAHSNNRQQTIAAQLLSYQQVKKYRIFILFITLGGYG